MLSWRAVNLIVGLCAVFLTVTVGYGIRHSIDTSDYFNAIAGFGIAIFLLMVFRGTMLITFRSVRH